MENRRETIVINKRFQYQWSLMIAALTVLLVNTFLIWRMVAPGTTPFSLPPTYALGIAAVELLLVGGIWYGTLHATHRIAGPIFVINRTLRQWGEGDLSTKIELRDTDMFQAEVAEMNASLAALATRVATVQSLANKLHNTGTEASHAALTELQDELAKLTTGNGG